MDVLTFQQIGILQPPPQGSELITLISSGTSQLQLSTIKTDFPKTIRLLNTLPATMAEAPGLNTFQKWELSSLTI